MSGVRHILFPVDFSDRCQEAAPVVRGWAEHLRARLTLLHATGVPMSVGAETSSQLYSVLEETLRDAGEAKMLDFVARHFADLPAGQAVETVLCESAPAAAIAGWAAQHKQTLVMMPTHGYGAFRTFLVGSVTASVLHDVACPVWTAAHRKRGAPPAGLPRRILCGVDRVEASVPLIRWAARLAEQCGAELDLIHVLPAVDEASRNRGEKAVRKFWQDKASKELEPILHSCGREEILLRGGPIADTLARAATELEAGLLVIGRGHLRKNLGRIRTHSMAIVCKSPCPVISV